MKMFLTRIGFHSKAVITGDITQIDLPAGKVSGLVEASKIVSKVKGIDFVTSMKATSSAIPWCNGSFGPTTPMNRRNGPPRKRPPLRSRPPSPKPRPQQVFCLMSENYIIGITSVSLSGGLKVVINS